MNLFETIGFSPANILLPKGVDMAKWSVVACDQFSSQPEYWAAVEHTVGDAPSSLRLILPEAQLHSPDVGRHIREIDAAMENYLKQGIFETLENAFVYVERTQSDGKVRRGLVGRMDLEQYDFTPGSGALIRATEGTVLSRLPARMDVRRNAPLELPHIMLLMDDPADTVLGPFRGGAGMEPLYSFPLMMGGGAVRGWRVPADRCAALAAALNALRSPAEMARKYGLPDAAPLLFAVGDGNHSLAAAKQCYEELKRSVPPESRDTLPARYALVELVNNHDDALRFEPIHRVLFGVRPDSLLEAFRRAWPDSFEGRGKGHVLEYFWQGHGGFLTVPNPAAQLPVGTLQTFLDSYLAEYGGEIDYIHGEETARHLGTRPGNMGFLLPAMGKDQLFKTVMADGVLPRKTFSMGRAQDKRYYLEGRKIR